MNFKTLTAIAALLLPCISHSAPNKINKNPKLPNGWQVHDMTRPMPSNVLPGALSSNAPSDAIVLFDGTNMDQWRGSKSKKVTWILNDGYMEVTPKTGSIASKQKFGDMQLHLEWAAPAKVIEKAQRRGNSGVFLMGRYEIQIMDCWENTAYPDGMTGAVYGQTPALVNACRKPGEWQSYDIIFTAPKFKDGKIVENGRVTAFLNGVLVQLNTEILGGTQHNKLPKKLVHSAKESLVLQNHGQKVRFKNIWVREL